MSLGPAFRTPFTDLTGSILNHQSYDKCGTFEMKMMDCLEAYGMERGAKKCTDLIADFQECVGMEKQHKRYMAMRLERHRQYLKGERKSDGHYAQPPRVDSY